MWENQASSGHNKATQMQKPCTADKHVYVCKEFDHAYQALTEIKIWVG